MSQFELPNNSQDFLSVVREDVEFVDPRVPSQLYFEPRLGSLVLNHGDALQLVLFRGQVPDQNSQPRARDLLNRPEAELGARNTVSGRGLYLGNSPESVAIFATKESAREVSVFATPPITDADIAIFASDNDTYTTRASAFMKEMKLFTRGFLTPHAKRLQKIEKAYEDKKLIVVDMHVGTRGAQAMQLQRFTHPVRPLWYLWRDMDAQFTRIGTASHQLSLRPWMQKTRHQVKKFKKT